MLYEYQISKKEQSDHPMKTKMHCTALVDHTALALKGPTQTLRDSTSACQTLR